MSISNKIPRLINWPGYLAITLAAALPLAVMTVRSGAWQQGLMLFALACLGATLILLLFIVLLLLPRFADWRPGIVRRALFTLPGTVLLLSLMSGSGDYPPIHDITTDLEDPPQFTQAEQQRGALANTLELDPEVIVQQSKAYPDIQTTLTTMPIDDAFDRALQLAREMGWEIYHQDLNAGIIEAVDTTAIMAFQDDVIIRVRSNEQGTLLDMRSVSRVGVSDLGANAKRIRNFQDQFEQSGDSG